MYNYVMLVGRAKRVYTEMIADKKLTHLILECQRCFPDVDGKYVKDEFDIRAWDFLGDAAQRIKEGSIINVKGRLLPSNSNHGLCMVIAERIMFMGGSNDEININGKEGC